MRKSTFTVPAKTSVSLASLVGRRKANLRPTVAARAAGFAGRDPEAIHETDLVSVLVESSDPSAVQKAIPTLRPEEQLEKLEGEFLSAKVGAETAKRMMDESLVTRMQTKKRSVPHLDAVQQDCGLLSAPEGSRVVAEDGSGSRILLRPVNMSQLPWQMVRSWQDGTNVPSATNGC